MPELHYFGFEHQGRYPFKVIPARIMTANKFYILHHLSPNVSGAGMYQEVTEAEFISSGTGGKHG